MFVPVLMYGIEKMLRKEKERSRITAVQMDNFRGLLGIRRMDRVPNSQIREFCIVTNGFSSGSAIWRGWRVIGLL